MGTTTRSTTESGRGVVGWLRRRLTYANVAATLALVLASSGTAYAVNTVRSADIVDGAVRSADIATNGVQSVDVKNGTIALADLSTGARNSLTAGAVNDLDDLDGLPCVVQGNPGTLTVNMDGSGVLQLVCVQSPLECTPPAPTGMNIVSTTCDTGTGQWVVTECAPGFADTNSDASDGCEAVAVEVCNGVDDDGDEIADEGLDYAVANGQVACDGSSGTFFLTCDDGFEPAGANVDDGCLPI